MTGANPEYSHLYDEIDSLKAINADLLATLETLCKAVEAHEGTGCKFGSAYPQARAAIARARGEFTEHCDGEEFPR